MFKLMQIASRDCRQTKMNEQQLFFLLSAGSIGSGAASSSSFGGSNGQGNGVNYGTSAGYTGAATYSPEFPYTPITTQQYSTQFYPNTNNANYQPQNIPYPNQFQNPYQFQNQLQSQLQNQFHRQQQQFPFVPFPSIPFAPFFPTPFAPTGYQQAFAQFQNSLQQQIARFDIKDWFFFLENIEHSVANFSFFFIG